MDNIRNLIEDAYADITHINHTDKELMNAVDTVISTLDCGGIRVAEKIANTWVTHDWIKKAILLSFRLKPNKLLDGGYSKFYDKLELKFSAYSEAMFKDHALRVVPDALVRKGAFIGRNAVLMPSYVNIGAYIGNNTMLDTWSTIGSCAQIGNNVHISGGVGIGGVLEPLQANPTIIEDDCFIGARSEIVEGVIVGKGSVISMGVYIGASTKIYDRHHKTITTGSVPPYSVVVPGTLPSSDGSHATYAAIIMKQVDEKTRAKASINELLRE